MRALRAAEVVADVHEAGDARAAFELLSQLPVDCVLIDHELAGDALDVLAAVRARGVDAAFIVLTEQVDEVLASELLRRGAADWLPKSRVSPEHLAQSIRHALRLRVSERREREAQAALSAQRAQRARLARAGPRIHRALSLEDAVETVGREARELLCAALTITRVEYGGLVVLTMAPELEAGLDARARHELLELARGLGTPSTLLQLSRAELSASPDVSALWRALARMRLHVDGWIVAPMITREGRPVGSLHLAAPPGGFADEDALLLVDLATTASIALENARLYRAAQQAAQARDDVLAIVSHDLRNPLNNIALSVSLLEAQLEDRRDDACGEQKQVVRIRRSVLRMNRLIEDLLEASRVESGRLTITLQPQRAGALLGEALDLALGAVEAKHARLVRGAWDEDAHVLTDRDRLLQVMANLLGNAIKFTPEGGTITVSLARLGDRAVVSVGDTGPGIDGAHFPRLFERYWKGPDATREGAGLGLFIARGIVLALGGTIEIESPNGQGTTVRFTLPLVEPVASVAPASDEPRSS